VLKLSRVSLQGGHIRLTPYEFDKCSFTRLRKGQITNTSRMKTLLKQRVFRSYTENSAELRRLERKVSHWLDDANFCVQLSNIAAQTYVPLSTSYSIMAQIRLKDVTAYRAIVESTAVSQVLRLGGADASIIIPSFLLPHHEHCLPQEPTRAEQQEAATMKSALSDAVESAQVDSDVYRVAADETTMSISAHGSLPAILDQSLLNFVAALVKATKVVEFEKDVNEDDDHNPQPGLEPSLGLDRTLSFADSIDSVETDLSSEPAKKTSRFKTFSKRTLQSLTDGTTKEDLREFTRDLQRASKDGFKKVAIAGMVNDRWIAKMVGRVAAKLEQAHGELGYSSDIPIALEPYRPKTHLASKLLP
jgi:hypothetical protein